MLLVKLKTFKHTPPDSVKFVSISNNFFLSWPDSFCHINFCAQPISSVCNILFKHYNNHFKWEILGYGENKSIKVNLFVEIYYLGFLLWNKFRIELNKVLCREFSVRLLVVGAGLWVKWADEKGRNMHMHHLIIICKKYSIWAKQNFNLILGLN